MALTVVSASGAEPLPTNGEKWHEIRRGKLPAIPQVLSPEFLGLLKVTVNSLHPIFLLVFVRLEVVVTALLCSLSEPGCTHALFLELFTPASKSILSGHVLICIFFSFLTHFFFCNVTTPTTNLENKINQYIKMFDSTTNIILISIQRWLSAPLLSHLSLI